MACVRLTLKYGLTLQYITSWLKGVKLIQVALRTVTKFIFQEVKFTKENMDDVSEFFMLFFCHPVTFRKWFCSNDLLYRLVTTKGHTIWKVASYICHERYGHNCNAKDHQLPKQSRNTLTMKCSVLLLARTLKTKSCRKVTYTVKDALSVIAVSWVSIKPTKAIGLRVISL